MVKASTERQGVRIVQNPAGASIQKNKTSCTAHVFTWPASGILKIPSLTNIINKIYLLNDTTTMLSFKITSDSIMIAVSASAPNATNSVVVLDVVGVPMSSPQGTAVDDHPSKILPSSMELNQNYPNPFNPTTVLSYELPDAGLVKLTVYDLLGHEVAVLVNEKKNAGKYSVQWDASRFSSGVYFCRLTVGSYTMTRKLLLLR